MLQLPVIRKFRAACLLSLRDRAEKVGVAKADFSVREN